MIKRILKRVLEIAFDRPLPPPSSYEKEFLSELKVAFCELSERDTKVALPSEAAWFRNMNRLQELVLEQNPREFLRWDVVSRTMFVSIARYISTELKYLKQHQDWDTRWRDAIIESPVGHPIPFYLYPASSGNLIHHAYHVAQFEDKTSFNIHDMDLVFEFGGGYGSMCRLFHNLGFRGKYVIFDLPAFSALQTYFLKTIGLKVLSIDEFANAATGVVCISDTNALKSLLGNHILATNKMFIATWSLSESPIALRTMILSLVSEFDSFLVAYQEKFGEVDNVGYFESWKNAIADVTWYLIPISHIPGSSYLVGSRRHERLCPA